LRTYWDSSAVINAAVSVQVLARLDKGDHICRLHALAEFFSTMTGRGVQVPDHAGKPTRVVFEPRECATWLKEFADKVRFEELEKAELLAGLDKAQSLGIQGGRIYDYWHALASKKANADELLTRNTDDFRGLAVNAVWP
jgi:hypothetical protein